MRQNHRGRGRAGVIPPFLWFRARPEPPRSGVLDQATLALVPLNLLSASTARSTCSKASTNPHPGSTDWCGDS